MPRIVLLDSNLFLVWVVGRVDPALVGVYERTSSYTAEDFELLVEYLANFEMVRVLPNIVTEVNNLLGKLKGDHKTTAHRILAQAVHDWEEQYVKSSDAVQQPEFMWLGITDSAVLLAARNDVLVATGDLKLYRELLKREASAVNFTHIRTRNWL
jgi:hypothetical protein